MTDAEMLKDIVYLDIQATGPTGYFIDVGISNISGTVSAQTIIL